MIYDYLTFTFPRNVANEYTFQVNPSVFTNPRLGKNMKMSVCQFQVFHNPFVTDRNLVSLVLNSPTIRNIGLSKVICLEGTHVKNPIIHLDTLPKTFVFTMINLQNTAISWVNASVIIEITYEEEYDVYEKAVMKKM